MRHRFVLLFRCETRPGPEYIIRSYTFDESGRAFLVQHHYWDDSCSSPQLTVLSHGRLQLRVSLIQPGAAAGTYKIANISVIPQDSNAAKELDRTVELECPGNDLAILSKNGECVQFIKWRMRWWLMVFRPVFQKLEEVWRTHGIRCSFRRKKDLQPVDVLR